MIVGVVGMGLIGASMAKAYKRAGETVYVYDRKKQQVDFAILSKAADGALDDDTIKECDVIFICLTYEPSIEWLKNNAEKFAQKTLVIDCCGLKKKICDVGFALADEYGFTFIGGHPMAGKQYSGFANSTETLYDGAPMIIVARDRSDINKISRLREILKLAGFGKISFMTADQHDDMIAFTSQLTHLSANAFVKIQKDYPEGFNTGGSFRDFTRVAELNEDMWSDLFLANRDNLLKDLNKFIAELTKFRKALEESDRDELHELLKNGRENKEEADKNDPVLTMKV
ncbi:MAG: prephenate dehydrogenase/arogenate dehydrogenase family protein [Eubacteriales bacterium]|nr:prephenate dehydrogenase/arogenate dehydrogenase family protein [Eubacteriales bacterium]